MDKRILVIDDEEGIRNVFRGAIKDTKYHVKTAESGEKALELLKKSKFNLIYLDLKMPGMNGIETLRELHKIDKDVPVYIVTAFHHEFTEQLKGAQADGISFEIMKKPIGCGAILDITKSVFEGVQLPITNGGKHKFLLFISGETPRSKKTIEDLKSLFENKLKGQYSLEIVDVIENPMAAYDNDIIATPTLIKTSLPPEKRFIGDFGNGTLLNLL